MKTTTETTTPNATPDPTHNTESGRIQLVSGPVPVPSTPKRKSREKTRSIEELTAPNVAVKTMSDKEKTVLIDHFKLEINKLTQQVAAYRKNAEEAFKKAQLFEQCCDSMTQNATVKFNDILQAVSVMYKTITLIVKDGKNND